MPVQLPSTTLVQPQAIGEGPGSCDATPAAAPGSQPAGAWNIGLPAAPGQRTPGASGGVGAALFQQPFPNASLADVLSTSASELLKLG